MNVNGLDGEVGEWMDTKWQIQMRWMGKQIDKAKSAHRNPIHCQNKIKRLTAILLPYPVNVLTKKLAYLPHFHIEGHIIFNVI